MVWRRGTITPQYGVMVVSVFSHILRLWARLVTVWVPLHDTPFELGGLCVLEGGHANVLPVVPIIGSDGTHLTFSGSKKAHNVYGTLGVMNNASRQKMDGATNLTLHNMI